MNFNYIFRTFYTFKKVFTVFPLREVNQRRNFRDQQYSFASYVCISAEHIILRLIKKPHLLEMRNH